MDRLVIDKRYRQGRVEQERRRVTFLECFRAYRAVATHSRGRADKKMGTSVYLDKNVGLFLWPVGAIEG